MIICMTMMASPNPRGAIGVARKYSRSCRIGDTRSPTMEAMNSAMIIAAFARMLLPPKNSMRTELQEQADEIYAAYPVKVGKPYAIRCIIRQLHAYDFEHILTMTRLYASTLRGEREFVPHPSTWFNQERFNDDPETWTRSTGMGDIRIQLQAIEQLIAAHPANMESSRYNPKCNGIQKDELDEYKRKRLALIKQIANR